MIFSLPGPKRFFNKIVDSLIQKKHVVIVLPDSVLRCDVYGAICQYLHGNELRDTHRIDLRYVSAENVFECIATEILVCNIIPPSIEELLQECNCRFRHIVIENGFGDDVVKNTAFKFFLRNIGELSQSIDDLQVQFIIIAKPTDQLPDRNVRLDIHPWWGVLGQLDVDLTVEDQLHCYPPQGVAEEIWLRSLCKGIARGNPCLAMKLIESSPMNLQEIECVLEQVSDFGISSVIMSDGVQPERTLQHQTSPPPCSEQDKTMWEHDVISWVKGYGLVQNLGFIHKDKKQEEIMRRIWIGEVELLMPIIESVRFNVVTWLDSFIGKKWPEQLLCDDQKIESLTSEIGPLSYALNSANRIKKLFIPQQIVQALDLWKGVRNLLAHSNYVEYDQIKKAVDMYFKMNTYLNK